MAGWKRSVVILEVVLGCGIYGYVDGDDVGTGIVGGIGMNQ